MDMNEARVKPRPPWLAAALSLVVPGLGQLYGGKPYRALAIYLCGIGLIILFMASGLLKVFAGLIAFILAFLAFFRGQSGTRSKSPVRATIMSSKFNRWYWYLAVWLSVGFLIAPQHRRVLQSTPRAARRTGCEEKLYLCLTTH